MISQIRTCFLLQFITFGLFLIFVLIQEVGIYSNKEYYEYLAVMNYRGELTENNVHVPEELMNYKSVPEVKGMVITHEMTPWLKGFFLIPLLVFQVAVIVILFGLGFNRKAEKEMQKSNVEKITGSD